MLSQIAWDSRTLRAALAAILLLIAAGCSGTPEEQYADYMERGKQYAEEGDYASALIEFKNAARVQPNEAEAHYQAALAHVEQNQTQEAVNAVQQAVRLDPNHVEASLLLARFMVRMGGSEVLPQAEEMLNSVLGQERNNSEALFILAATRAKQGAAEDAERLLEESLGASPDHLQSSMALASMRLREGKVDEAEKVLLDAIERSEDAEGRKMAQIALGQFYMGQEQDDKAEERFEAILDDDPKYGPALLALGMLHLKHKKISEAEAMYRRASELPEPQYRSLYAQVLMANGKPDQAITEYERLLREHPDDRDVRTRLVAAYLDRGQEKKAEELLAGVLSEKPNDSAARLQRAEVFRRSGQLDRAQEDLSKALEYRPNSHQAHYSLAKIHAERGDRRLQQQELDEALRIDPGFLPARLELAQSLLQSSTPESALNLLNEAPEAQRNSAGLISARIWSLIALKRFDAAQAELNKIPEAQRDTAEFNLQQGLLKSYSRDFAGARPYLQRAIEQNPTDVRAINALGGSYAAENKMAAAIKAVEDHAKKYPNSPEIQLILAAWYDQADYDDQAMQAYQRAHEAGDRTGQSSVMLARMAAQRGDTDRAEQILNELLTLNPRHVGALLMLGLIQDGAGDTDAALKTYRSVVDRFPDNSVALNNLAYILAVKKNSLEEALTFAQRAKEIAPDSAEVDDTLGWIYYLRGVYPTAQVHLKQAVANNPRSPVIRYHLAMAQAKAGNVAEAEKTLQAALAMDSSPPEAAQAQKVLDEMR